MVFSPTISGLINGRKKEAKVAAQSRKQTKNKSPVHVVHYQHCITGAECKNITFEQTNETSENRLIFF